MVVLEAFGLASAELFNYNREIFKFDQEQRLEKDMARVEYQIKRFDLFREDIEDLVKLTVSKMDMYHMVGALLLAFTCTIYTEGLFRGIEPPWYTGLYFMAVCNSFIYLLLSVWLSMHASIQAQSFGARLRTRFVRLPIPSFSVINDLTAKFADFERQGLAGLMRLPFSGNNPDWKRRNALDTQGEGHVRRPGEWLDSSTRGFKFGAASGKGGGVGGGGGDEGTQGSELIGRGGDGFGREEILTKAAKTLPGRHVQLFRDLQAKWQCYDAYARVCMSIGVNQMIQSINYFVVGATLVERNNPSSAIAISMVFQVVALGLAFLDIADKPISRALPAPRGAQIVMMQAIGSSPIFIAVVLLILGRAQCEMESDVIEQSRACLGRLNPYSTSFYVAPCCFFMQAIWFQLQLLAAWPSKKDDASLPRKFLAVLFLDVFGDASYDPTEAEQAPVTASDSPLNLRRRQRETQIAAAEDALAIGQAALRRWEAVPPELLSDSQTDQLDHLRRDYMFWRQRLQGHIVQAKLARGVVDDPSVRDAQELRAWNELSEVEKREDEFVGFVVGPLKKRNMLRNKTYFYDLEANTHILDSTGGHQVLTLPEVVNSVEAVKTQVRTVLAEADIPDRESQEQVEEDQAPRMGASRSKKPGKKERLPWKLVRRLTNILQLSWTFLGVQLALQDAGVWTVGWMYDSRELRAVDDARDAWWTRAARVDLAWPHGGFFRPTALACMPSSPASWTTLALGDHPARVVLLSGPYATYEVAAEAEWADAAPLQAVALPRRALPRGATVFCRASSGEPCWVAALASQGRAVYLRRADLGEEQSVRLPLEDGAPAWRLLAGGVAPCSGFDAHLSGAKGFGAAGALCFVFAGWDGARIPVALVPLAGDGLGAPENATLRPRFDAPLDGAAGRPTLVASASGCAAPDEAVALQWQPASGRLWALVRSSGGRADLRVWSLTGAGNAHRRLPVPRPDFAADGFEATAVCEDAAGSLWIAGVAGQEETPELVRVALASASQGNVTSDEEAIGSVL